VAHAEVSLISDGGVRRVMTSTQGIYELDGAAPGRAVLRVRARGFAPAEREVMIPPPDGRREPELSPVELAEGALVEGEVVDSRGERVAQARVARDRAPTWVVVGAPPAGVVVTDSQGRFSIGELPEGSITLEAYAVGAGRGRAEGIAVQAGRTTGGVRIVLVGSSREDTSPELAGRGSVAVTLGETSEPVEVVITAVADGSEAERSGLAVGDVIASVDGTEVRTMKDARERLNGPLTEEVIVSLRRGTQTLPLRVPREPVRR
jgi:S1-C subfamily serine protease